MKEQPYPPAGYSWYVVGVLTLVYVFSFIDRQILSLLVTPIRRDLGISDTAMSLLMGFGFALFYTSFGIPLGRLADSRSRRSIVAAGFVLWSLFTAACGLARNFAQMLLMRIGVGVGEATLSPAAYSLISDYFPPHRRATAMSVYGMGIYIGSGLAYLLGGMVVGIAAAQDTWIVPLLGAMRPWQLIFLAVGLPGLPLAALLYTVREPPRRGGAASVAKAPVREVIAYMRRNRWTLFCHTLGFALISMRTYSGGSWIPSFFTRVHGWSAAEIGIWMGIIVAIFGSLGIVAGGWLADRLALRGCRDSKMRVALYAILLSLPPGMWMLLTSSDTVAIVLYAPTVFLTSAPFGVAPAAIQEMMPNSMRGQASALYLFVNSMVGLGIGPTAVAVLTDSVFHDDKAVGYSLLVVGVASSIGAATLLSIGLRQFRSSMDRLKEFSTAPA